ncbi:MAG: hypothetical protein JWN76_2384 [Chitinophagaceae bacterium]|nr:hypothetical protein [Chitinophagaceae bacterium]
MDDHAYIMAITASKVITYHFHKYFFKIFPLLYNKKKKAIIADGFFVCNMQVIGKCKSRLATTLNLSSAIPS